VSGARSNLRELAGRSRARWPALGRLGRPLRFGLVGLSGVIVNTAVLWALVHGALLPVLPASALATEASILSNFLLNDSWTFGAARRGPRWLRLLRFNGVALGGMLITAAVLGLLLRLLPIGLISANLVAVAAATAWNYVANTRWTWRG
jgi:dolichol-phosphate mannosyltransferase